MNDRLIVYKNNIWKVIYDFKCVNGDQPFTLPSGTYLFICKGGRGGVYVPYEDAGTEAALSMGGVSYGVITLNTTETFHAVVGGNGADVTNDYDYKYDGKSILNQVGGFNGGAHGGVGRDNDSIPGGGGGGASDIRLLAYDPNEYPTNDPETAAYIPPANPVVQYEDADAVPGVYDETHIFQQLDYYDFIGFNNIRDEATASDGNYFITDYIPNENTRVELDCVLMYRRSTKFVRSAIMSSRNSSSSNEFSFYTVYASSFKPTYRINSTVSQTIVGEFVWNQRIKLVMDINKVEWFLNGTSVGSITRGSATIPTYTVPFTIGGTCNGTNVRNVTEPSFMKFYGCKIYEGETLVRDYIPTTRLYDGKIYLYDRVANMPMLDPIQGVLPTALSEYKRLHPSLDSRIMVAGGGGACVKTGAYVTSIGGGINGGYMDTYDAFDPNSRLIANQTYGFTEGYSKMPVRKASNEGGGAVGIDEGCGGGGGGWYGGFTYQTQSKKYTTSINGGGGSGYVLTASSYKPDGYNPNPKYYFTDVFQCSGQSVEGEIIICELTDTYSTGDTIEFPCIGEQESITLKKGEYAVQCYGGDGGSVKFVDSSRGGYSQGRLSIDNPVDIYVNVGGCGFMWNYGSPTFDADDHTTAIQYMPIMAYNGGGLPSMTYDSQDQIPGGGATDIRIGGDTLYHRLIVAGGAGANGTALSGGKIATGGAGGGLTSGVRSVVVNNSGVNDISTQSSAPTDFNATYAGSFGNGGKGYVKSTTYKRCAGGGGGWYGGSGVYDNQSRQTIDGAQGGSGYVYTGTSYIVPGYLVPEKYQLINATMDIGGNTLPLFTSMAKINVDYIIEPCIARDADGYKAYNQSNQTWELIVPQPSALTKDVFDAHPTSFFKSDNGLSESYALYIYDESDSITHVGLLSTPNRVSVKYKTDLDAANVLSASIDYDADDSIFTVVYSAEKGLDGLITIVANVDIAEPTKQKCEIYSASVETQGTSSTTSYRYYSKEEVTPSLDCEPDNPCYGTLVKPRGEMEDYRDPDTGVIETAQWLLPTKIGGSKSIPTFIVPNLTDENTTTRYTSTCTVSGRSVYIGTITVETVEGSSVTYFDIKRFNYETNQIHPVDKIRYDLLSASTYYGMACFLVDDNYYYLRPTVATGSAQTQAKDVSRIITVDRTTLNVLSYQMSTNTSGWCTKMDWYDDTHRTIINICESRVSLFDIIGNVYTYYNFPSSYSGVITDFAVGKKKVCFIIPSPNPCKIFFFDKETHGLTIVTTPWVSQYQGTYAAVCYNDGKFYFATKNLINVYDEETLSCDKQVITPIGDYPTSVVYENNALIINCYQSNYIMIYDLKTDSLKSTYTQYQGSNSRVSTHDFRKIPCAYKNLYLDSTGVGLFCVNYVGTLKYNLGKKYTQAVYLYNAAESENIEYDESYCTLTDECAVITDGYLKYPVSTFTNHIANVNVNKSDYKFAYDLKTFSEGG